MMRRPIELSMIKLKMAASAQHHLVLVPGLDGSGDLFDPLLSVLPPTFEASVVRFPPNELLSHHELFGLIRSVIPWDRPYVVVAESSAGPLALKFVQAQRQDIRAVVLSASFVSNPLRGSLKWATSLFAKSWLEREPTPKLVRQQLLGEDAPDLLVDRATEALLSLKPEVRAAHARMVLKADARQELQACDKPILYLQPTQDQFMSEDTLEEIKRLKPSVHTAVIPGPHALLQRSPREALEAIRAFLAGLPSN